MSAIKLDYMRYCLVCIVTEQASVIHELTITVYQVTGVDKLSAVIYMTLLLCVMCQSTLTQALLTKCVKEFQEK